MGPCPSTDAPSPDRTSYPRRTSRAPGPRHYLPGLGELEDSIRTLREGSERFPADRALSTSLALTLHNPGEHRESTSIPLKNPVETTADPGIQPYGRALGFYADHPEATLG